MANNAAQKIKDNLPKLLHALDVITHQEVLVGVPKDTTERRESGGMNNATLAYIHDNGSPAANIPARPFMRPGIKAAQPKLIPELKAAAQAGENGKDAVVAHLHRAGLIAQNYVRAKINEGIPPPLALSTIKARARKGRKGAKKYLEELAAGGTSDTSLAKPLIDTGQLRNSITYVVRTKK